MHFFQVFNTKNHISFLKVSEKNDLVHFQKISCPTVTMHGLCATAEKWKQIERWKLLNGES